VPRSDAFFPASRGGATARLARLERTLRGRGGRARAEGEKAYLKSDLEFLGVDAATLRRTAREFLAAEADLGHRALLALVRAAWRRPVHELRAVAIALLEARADSLRAEEMPLLESMLRRSGSWAYVDWICLRLVAPLVEREPDLARTLDRWARDDDFWIRRSALLSLLPAIRRGGGDWRRFERYADAMIDEREFFIRKAIGWVLREAGKQRPERVVAFLRPRLHRAAGLTRREAVKYLPPAHRRQLFGGSQR
jgi:3-methyladenine DNA glycosylase AlkD